MRRTRKTNRFNAAHKVINEAEMQETWRVNCGTEVVSTTRTAETTLKTLREHIASFSIEDSGASKYDVIDMAAIASRFAMDPRNWISKK